MNRWKTAFWTLFVVSFFLVGMLAYNILDQGVSLTYMKEGYSDTEADLQSLVKIINKKNLSQESILHILNRMKSNTDTIALNRLELFFKSGQLDSIKQAW